jgi:hypothetical protein
MNANVIFVSIWINAKIPLIPLLRGVRGVFIKCKTFLPKS